MNKELEVLNSEAEVKAVSVLPINCYAIRDRQTFKAEFTRRSDSGGLSQLSPLIDRLDYYENRFNFF